jgi:hypothetical protein
VQHQQRWELLRQEEQITALERAVTDARASLHDERERGLRLQEKIDGHIIQETKDRATIQRLLALTTPVASLPSEKGTQRWSLTLHGRRFYIATVSTELRLNPDQCMLRQRLDRVCRCRVRAPTAAANRRSS